MVIIVTGSRTWTDTARIWGDLDQYDPKAVVIWHGGARGADEIADRWARIRGARLRRWLADWATLGKSAGPIRSEEMIASAPPSAIVRAYLYGPADGSRGTAYTIELARRRGLETRVVQHWK